MIAIRPYRSFYLLLCLYHLWHCFSISIKITTEKMKSIDNRKRNLNLTKIDAMRNRFRFNLEINMEPEDDSVGPWFLHLQSLAP